MKYKFLTYVPVLAAALASFTSCSEGFLDREPEGSYITKDQLEKALKWNPNIMLGYEQGVVRAMTREGAGGSTDQHDFGQKSTDLATDLISHDMVMSMGSNYGYWKEECNGQSTVRTSRRTKAVWYTYYRMISACNNAFSSIGSDEEAPQNADVRIYWAECKTARAYAYFNLENLYNGDYATCKSKKVLPIYSLNTTGNQAPSTNEKVYEFILKDLNEAIAAYKSASEEGVTPTSIDQPSLSVAYTLKAYANLQMGNNQEAAAAAKLAIAQTKADGLSILPKSNLYNGFNTINHNTNWMWGMDVMAENTGGLGTFWGMMDIFTYSYASAGDFKVINSDLFHQIPQTDARREWFTENPFYNDTPSINFPNGLATDMFGIPAKSDKALLPTGKFYSNKLTHSVGNRTGEDLDYDMSWESDIHFMRVEECYLIAAEAEARQNHLTEACTYLKAILDNRDEAKASAISSMTQEQLLDEIFFNWRVEMWGEGKSLMTFKRFHKDIEIPENDDFNGTPSYSWDSKKLIFAIPDQELKYNPLMKEADQ